MTKGWCTDVYAVPPSWWNPEPQPPAWWKFWQNKAYQARWHDWYESLEPHEKEAVTRRNLRDAYDMMRGYR